MVKTRTVNHVGFERPWVALACNVLRRAVLDFRRGQSCGGAGCVNEVHGCSKDAVEFLTGPWAACLFDVAGVDQGEALQELGIDNSDQRRKSNATPTRQGANTKV